MSDRRPAASRAAHVVAELRRDIISAVFAQGERLTEDRLSERYSVSRVPVREALRVLQVEGFVSITPYTGTRVAALSADEASDLLEVRQALEETAARRAAQAPPGSLAHLSDLLETGTRAYQAGRFHELPEHNTALHAALVDAAGNRSLSALHRQIRDKIQWVYATALPKRAASSWAEHKDIVDAVLDGKSRLAGQLISAHVARSAATYRYRTLSPYPRDCTTRSIGHQPAEPPSLTRHA